VSLDSFSAIKVYDRAGFEGENDWLVATAINLLEQVKQTERRAAQPAAVMDVEDAFHSVIDSQRRLKNYGLNPHQGKRKGKVVRRPLRILGDVGGGEQGQQRHHVQQGARRFAAQTAANVED
jgi:hypothetical protein